MIHRDNYNLSYGLKATKDPATYILHNSVW